MLDNIKKGDLIKVHLKDGFGSEEGTVLSVSESGIDLYSDGEGFTCPINQIEKIERL